MESFILWSLAIVMMFAGTHCISTSRSCTTVNGQTTCTSDTSNGNFAGSSSGVVTSGNGYYQQTSAGTGNTYSGASSSSQSSSGNLPPGAFAGPIPGPFDPFAAVNLPNPFNLFGGGGAGAFAFGRR